MQTLTKGGTYTLTVGNLQEPSTGTYQLRLTNVPEPDQFNIRLSDRIKPGVPRAGAGVIETPGAEDIYVFTASPGQQVVLRLLERVEGLSYNRWRLLDDNGMELFDTCFGCNQPPVQRLTVGGKYTLIVGNTKKPSTGAYSFELAALR